MTARAAAIFVSDTAWAVGLVQGDEVRVVEVEVPGDASIPEKAAAVRRLLDEHHIRSASPVLALPSTWCFASSITTRGLLRHKRYEGMCYRLEERLPLDAETLAADFIEWGATQRRRESEQVAEKALGVCTQTGKVRPILDALEEQGVTIIAICPLACLVLQATDAEKQGNTEPADVCLVRHGERIDLFRLENGLPRCWHAVPAATGDLRLHLRRQALESELPLRVTALGLGDDLRRVLDELKCEDAGNGNSDNGSLLGSASLAADRCAQGRGEALIDLRRGALADADRLRRIRTPLVAALTALVVALLCLGGIGLWRAHRYEMLAAQLRAEQNEIFRRAFPQQNVPVAVLARLRSEARQLRGLSGAGGELPRRASALNLLHAVLSGLPTDLRYRVLELRLDSGRLYLDGQARSHGDADMIAAGLRQTAVFTVKPPRTENLADEGVAFTVTGTPLNPLVPLTPHGSTAPRMAPAEPSVETAPKTEGGGS